MNLIRLEQNICKHQADHLRTDRRATANSTLVKWRGSQQICKSQFHS